MSAVDNSRTDLSPGRMILLGVGWFGFQVFWAFHSATMPLFLAGFTDSKFRISLVLGLSGVSGFLVPPIVGSLSDRSASRFGRRTPFVVIGMVGVAISVLVLARLQSFGGVAVAAGLMYLAVRTAETPYLSLLPDMTPVDQRSTASGVMNLVGSIGLILCFVAGAVLWERSPQGMFALVAAACAVSTVSGVALLREPPRLFGDATSPVTSGLRGLFEERDAARFLFAQFFWWLGFWMASSFLVLFAAEEIGVAEGRAYFVPLVFSLVATVSMLPTGVLGDRFGRKRFLSAMIAVWALSGLVVGMTRSLPELLVAVGLTGVPFAAVMVVGYAYFLDLIPAERTAEFVGLGILTGALAQIAGPLIGGQLIDAIGYRALFPAAAAFQLAGLMLLQRVDDARGTTPGGRSDNSDNSLASWTTPGGRRGCEENPISGATAASTSIRR